MKTYNITVEELGSLDMNTQELVDDSISGFEHLVDRNALEQKILTKALAIGIKTLMNQRNPVKENREDAFEKIKDAVENYQVNFIGKG